MSQIRARYGSTCAACGGRIEPGDLIEWSRGAAARHVTCPTRQAPAAPATPAPIQFSTTGHSRNDGPAVGSTFRHRQHGIVTVLSSRGQYIREDGMSFGLMDESGWLFAVGARPATEAEAAPVLEREARTELCRTARARLAAIAKQIEQAGEYPARTPEGIVPEGDRVFDTQDIYGGGGWFVVGPEYIWYCRNNGADGDDWGRNNVRTGGAGAIGRRVPFDQALADEIRALAATLAETKVD